MTLQANQSELEIATGAAGDGVRPHSIDRAVRTLFMDRSGPSAAVLLLTFGLALLLAWHNRFIQDDAFISFKYALNLYEGRGLVWNFDDRVEGYSNFLWVLILAGSRFVFADPVPTSQLLGLGFYAGTLAFSYAICRRYFTSPNLAWICLILLASNYSFSSYATGGLETALQLFTITLGLFLTLEILHGRRWNASTLLGLATTLILGLMTRMDTAIFFAIYYAYVLAQLLWGADAPHGKARKLIQLLLPPTLVLGAWFVWRYHYYGDLLPNTFYVKASTATSIDQGLYYQYLFFSSYLLMPLLLLFLLKARTLLRDNPAVPLLCLLFLAWSAYVLKVGGDFMEFRFMVPIIPTLFFLIIAAIGTLRSAYLRGLAILLILGGSYWHATNYRSQAGIESIYSLEGHLTVEGWDEIGKTLGERFGSAQGQPVTIATMAAGAIPYYSGLRTIDTLGLNDHWVARNGYVAGHIPGHQRYAPLHYLLEQNVHLLIGHPYTVPNRAAVLVDHDEILRKMHVPEIDWPSIPTTARLISIPVGPDRNLLALYLRPNSAINRMIESQAIGAQRLLLSGG